MQDFIVPLNKVSRDSLNLVGGKAVPLGEMLNAKIPVPPGFVVTTNAFRMGMTEELKREILSVFNQLDAERVAVRSSAMGEDSHAASWAGQLDSYLNITKHTLINAVTKCWESIETERAIKYAEDHGIRGEQHKVAVIVQEMVDSDISGVTFTANPINKSREEFVIEAIFGLGELLVQGVVTPENLIVDAKSGEVLQREVHRQDKMLVYEDGRNTLMPLDSTKIGQKILDESLVSQLCQVARRITMHFDRPQDIEWAFEKGTLYILQSRPITTL